ncbi:ribosome recycling factor [Candidatus Roizmanbacteria bacterium RIFCSPHIGHO2_12_FULL_44_10]|uniref:Ribosome recycling factor n=1 Tax=Candidatus Roizmanbacteria bacterium RIFCSPHIGHO2_12_FULL_44_10 TaxID=1802054 RepID=A0A1F7I7T6_9BACT|nr:MAG: ribosome recycling factor [Candidatus Roizmanbacteria bacterium RIFCSPHIGHO2_12_FULL_44_10]
MPLDSIYNQFNKRFQEISHYVTEQLRQIRTGKASPSLVENIEVAAYGGQSILKLRELASIATEGPTLIIIDPFDPAVTQEIEKAIRNAPLGLSPSVDGKIIRIVTPPLTEEQRNKYVKLANEKVEEGKIQVRGARDEARKKIKALFDEKSLSEDDKFRGEKELDKISKESVDKLDELKKRKHDEIMTI